MREKRGSGLLKNIDRYIGGTLLFFLIFLLAIKGAINSIGNNLFPPGDSKPTQGCLNAENCLVVCFGAIGDLILLTQAAKIQLAHKKVYLACTSSNQACADLYKDFYAGIEIVDIRSLTSLSNVCKKHKIKYIFDSTQWANIGAILTGISRLFAREIQAIGFNTKSNFRNRIYTTTVEHSNQLHEVGNFINLLAIKPIISSNADIKALAPILYEHREFKNTKKILFHLWPSGTRSYLKEWPISYWVELARHLAEEGYEIYLSGSPADAARNEKLITQSNLPIINIAGKLNLSELKNFITQNIDFAVCVNTGIMHLTTSQGVPVIGLHGPTNPNRWGPLGSELTSLLPSSGLSSYLHYGFEYPKDDQAAYSLDKLDVSQVIDAVKLLNHRH